MSHPPPESELNESSRKCQPGLQSIQISDQLHSHEKKPRKSSLKLNRAKLIKKQLRSVSEKYEIGEKLGEGSFGQVFKVQHKQLKIDRALKIVKKTQKGAIHNSYEQLEVLKKLDHPNILKVFEYFETPTHWLIITEYFEGKQLFDQILETKSLSEKRAARIFSEICKALAYIHANGIAHRDIKPENILIHRKETGCDSVKLIDWGLATLAGQSLTRRCGTPEYCAPEVVKSQEYGLQCDLWSLGVMLFVMLSGRFPIKGDTLSDTLLKVSRGNYCFKGQAWDEISLQAKQQISNLMQIAPHNRISASACLKHPWVVDNLQGSDCKSQQLAETLRRIRDIVIQNKFQAVVINFIQNYLTASQNQSALKEQFQALDQNSDGVLSHEELLNAYTAIYGPVQAEKVTQEIFDKIDLDGSGQIQYSEFVTFASQVSKRFSKQQLKEAFSFFDDDGNGKINKSEIYEVISYERGTDNSELESVLKGIDIDGDGSISLEEFIECVNQAVQRIPGPREIENNQQQSREVEDQISKARLKQISPALKNKRFTRSQTKKLKSQQQTSHKKSGRKQEEQ